MSLNNVHEPRNAGFKVFLGLSFARHDKLSLGKTTGIFNGIELPVYNRERTICDCFK